MPAMLSDDAEKSPALLSDDTLDALQLHSQPFLPAEGPEGLHVDAANDARLAELAAALRGGDDLLLLLGPMGAGKSSLLALLQADAQASGVQCFPVAGSERFDTHNLFAGMLEAFKVEPPDELQQTLDDLAPCLQDMHARQLSTAVVIDDAERIPDAELTRLLSALLYLNGGNRPLLRLLLAAPEDFEDQIPDLIPHGADLPYAALPLEPLDAERGAELLSFRLAQAGLENELPFDEDDLQRLEERTAGWPGPLLTAAANLLNERHGPLRAGLTGALPFTAAAGRSGLSLAHGRLPKLLLGALALLLILAGLLLFLPAPPPSSSERYTVAETRRIEPSAPQLETPLSDAADATAVAGGETDPAETTVSTVELRGEDRSENVSDARSDDAAEPVDETGESNRAATTDTAAESHTGSATVRADGDTSGLIDDDRQSASGGDTAEPEKAPAASDGAQLARSTPTPELPASDARAAQGAGAPSVPGTAVTEADADPSGLATETSEAEAQAPAPPRRMATETAERPQRNGSAPARPVAADSSTDSGAPELAAGRAADTASDSDALIDRETETAAEPADTARTLESPNWVLVQRPDQYTIQMIAAVDRESIEEFLEEHALAPPNSVFSFERRGATWHAMVHGLYPSIEAAQAAIDRLPEAARVNQPWIRSISRLQRTLREQEPQE